MRCINCHEPGARVCNDCLRAMFVGSIVAAICSKIVDLLWPMMLFCLAGAGWL